MRKLRNKLNNSGSTLLLVIVCIAFIGILGSLMLSVSATNFQMKMIESKSKENFYSCEIAMEEIRVGVQELTAETIKTIYENTVLPSYASFTLMSVEEQNTKIQNLVILDIIKKLGDTGTLTDVEIINTGDNFSSKLVEFQKYISTSDYLVVIGELKKEINSILIKNIKITYVNLGYETSITSDIRITIPAFTVAGKNVSKQTQMNQPFEQYALIADAGITAKGGNDLGLSTSIKGNVYAGDGGITVESDSGLNELVIDGKNIVTRGDITVYDKGKLTIDTPASTIKPVIWADNLATMTTKSFLVASTSNPILNIKGICIVKDDLVLEGHNSNVTIEGSYIGYTSTHSAKGSAIMVNGSGSSLNLSGLSTLLLAGRAHVSVEDDILTTPSSAVTTDILTGESLAFKSNQRAYLLPGEYIKNISHNPVTQKDVDLGVPNIDFMVTIEDNTIDYATYVPATPTDRYKIAAKQISEGGPASTLRYYYLNFASGKRADAFLGKFMTERPEELSYMEPFTLGNVILPSTDKIKAVGNLMSYDIVNKKVIRTPGMSLDTTYNLMNDQELDTLVASHSLTEDTYFSTGLQNKAVSQLEKLYSNMTHLLSIEDTTTVYGEDDMVTDSYLVSGGVSRVVMGVYSVRNTEEFVLDAVKVNPTEAYSFTTLADDTKKSFVIIDGDVIIQDGATLSGILIASGNITIGKNAIIRGLVISVGESGKLGNVDVNDNVKVHGQIIAGNNITLGENCRIETDSTYISDIFSKEGDILSEIIKNTGGSINFSLEAPSTFIGLSSMISYENWRKD